MTNSDMPFLEHLAELRTRLLWSVVAWVGAAFCCLYYADHIFAFLTYPAKFSGTTLNFIGTGPAEAFLVKLKVSFFAGFVVGLPVIFYQTWQFVAPGLLARERTVALPFVIFSSSFFIAGLWFCYTIVLPFAFDFFLAEYNSINISPEIRIGEYLSFVLNILLVFGTIFEAPVLTYFLARLGIVKSKWLVSQTRFAVLIIFILAAILTPPDVLTQLLLAGPMLVLYALCCGVAVLVEKQGTSNIEQ